MLSASGQTTTHRQLTPPLKRQKAQLVAVEHAGCSGLLDEEADVLLSWTSCVIHEGPGDVKSRLEVFDFRNGGLVVVRHGSPWL